MFKASFIRAVVTGAIVFAFGAPAWAIVASALIVFYEYPGDVA